MVIVPEVRSPEISGFSQASWRHKKSFAMQRTQKLLSQAHIPPSVGQLKLASCLTWPKVFGLWIHRAMCSALVNAVQATHV